MQKRTCWKGSLAIIIPTLCLGLFVCWTGVDAVYQTTLYVNGTAGVNFADCRTLQDHPIYH
jgi:hypothetical protein